MPQPDISPVWPNIYNPKKLKKQPGNNTSRFLFCAIVPAVCFCPDALASTDSTWQADFAEKYARGVVAVVAELANGDRSMGSGFFVTDNLIATNAHVVADAITISVAWDEDFEDLPLVTADVIAIDEKNDVVLLQTLEALGNPLPLLSKKAKLSKGDGIAILGFPAITQDYEEPYYVLHVFGGMLSAFLPPTRRTEQHPRLILDARIFQGCSGSPVISQKFTRVIGIASEVIADLKENDDTDTDTISSYIHDESIGVAVSIAYVQKLLDAYVQ